MAAHFLPSDYSRVNQAYVGGGSGICRGMTEAMMRHGARAAIVGRKYVKVLSCKYALLLNEFCRLDRLVQTAKELSESTGQECLPVRADVRQPGLLKEAVDQTISKFGRIDFVICGWYLRLMNSNLAHDRTPGAAGNFLAPIAGMSENAFKTVLEIDTVRSVPSRPPTGT